MKETVFTAEQVAALLPIFLEQAWGKLSQQEFEKKLPEWMAFNYFRVSESKEVAMYGKRDDLYEMRSFISGLNEEIGDLAKVGSARITGLEKELSEARAHIAELEAAQPDKKRVNWGAAVSPEKWLPCGDTWTNDMVFVKDAEDMQFEVQLNKRAIFEDENGALRFGDIIAAAYEFLTAKKD